MSKGTIWIVNYYTSSPEKAGNPRYIEFTNNFLLAGYEVVTFNSSRSEGIVGQKELFKDVLYGPHHFVHVKSPDYEGNGLKRMWSIFVFALCMWIHCKRFQKPDIVLHNLHTPFDYPIMWMAHRLKAKYIAEAWDLWPEDFVTFGLVGAGNPAMKFFYYLEKRLYAKADQIVFTLEGGADYIRSKGWDKDNGGPIDMSKVHYINSGVNVELFDAWAKSYTRPDEDLKDPDTYKILYMGSIRLVNNVKQLIDAAAILKKNPKYRFFIYGDGPDREPLIQYCRENAITNVVFKEKRIPFHDVAYVVSQATVNIMNYQKNFGIHGVSSGKMFQYFAAGKPICCNIKLNYSEISRRNLGIDRELDTPEQYAAAIKELAEQPSNEYQAMCDRVRQAAWDFDYKKLSAEEIRVIEL